MKEPTYEEVLDIMVDGGKKLCDYALDKWISYSYCGFPPTPEDEKMRQEYLKHWHKIKDMIDRKWTRQVSEEK